MTTLNIQEEKRGEEQPVLYGRKTRCLELRLTDRPPVSWEQAVLHLIYLGKCFLRCMG